MICKQKRPAYDGNQSASTQMREEPSSAQTDHLALVGGPFCGIILDAPIGMFEPGSVFATPCIWENSPRQVWHLDAAYVIGDDHKALFHKYVPSKF